MIETKFPVEDFGYEGLVQKMSQTDDAGEMGQLVADVLKEMPKPKFEAERDYFWKALHNAARKDAKVWLHFIVSFPQYDTGKGLYTMPQMTKNWDLPKIDLNGKLINWEEERKIKKNTKVYPSDPTEENFEEQARQLENFFKATVSPEDRCKNVKEYVDSFRYSGTGKISAMFQLADLGLKALATQEGTNWLIKEYPE